MLTLWFFLTFLSLIFVTIDLYRFKCHRSIKIGFWVSVLFTGIFGLLMYIIATKTLFADKTPWKKALGTTSIILATQGVALGIVFVFLNGVFLAKNASFWMQFFAYLFALGFGFFIYQRVFFLNFVNRVFSTLLNALIAQFILTNALTGGFFFVCMVFNAYYPESRDIELIHFWGMLSLAYILGAITLYPFVLWQTNRGLLQGITYDIKNKKKCLIFTEKEVHPIKMSLVFNKIFLSVLLLLLGVFLGFFWAYQIKMHIMTQSFYF